MNKLALISTLLGIFACIEASSNVPFIRFINALDHVNISIQTDKLPSMELSYMQASNYTEVDSGSLDVQIFDTLGLALTNISMMVQFDYYCTIIIIKLNNTIVLVPFNETVAPTMVQNVGSNDTIPDRAWIRLINAVSKGAMISIFANSDIVPLYSNVGFLEATPYVEVDPSSNKFLLSWAQTSSQFVLVPSFEKSNAYTAVAFDSQTSGFSGALYWDRFVPMVNASSVATTGMTNLNSTVSTSGSSTSTSTGHTEIPTSLAIKHFVSSVLIVLGLFAL